MTDHQHGWPAVSPDVVAEVVGGLSPRLRKRLDAAAAKLAERPPVRTGDDWRLELDEETGLVLHGPGGVVRSAADIRCGCLLAPACLHRAAAATAAPLAAPESASAPEAANATPANTPTPNAPNPPTSPLTPAELAAAEELRRATATVLAAGVSGAGAVPQAELLHAAHRARLLGLYRPAALAVGVVTRLRAARAAEPDHRLADLVAALSELLDVTTMPTPEARGTARQVYEPVGSLRLYGLFAEPVLTATHTGVLTWTVDGAGRLSTVAEITPHADPVTAAPLALAAAGRAVRLGDTLLSQLDLTRAGLVVQGATRSANGRLGAGAAVHAVRAAGSSWTEGPAAALWERPAGEQVARALASAALPYDSRPAGADLLFLDVTLLGGGRADCAGLTVTLLPAHPHPGLPYRANLALLAAAPGLRLRVIGRLERAADPRLRLLAISADTLPPQAAGRLSLGLEPLRRADLPPLPDGPSAPLPAPLPPPPVHLLTRRIEQAVTSGRRALSPSLGRAEEATQLRACGLPTAALLLDHLRASATDQQRDPFGRLLPDDQQTYPHAWLAATRYTEELATALCTDAWSAAG